MRLEKLGPPIGERESTQAAASPQPSGLPRRSAGRWWIAALTGQFVFVFATVALSGPGRIDIVDGQTRYEVARSLVEHGDSAIRDKHVWFRVHEGRDGAKYTPYRFPQSGLGAVAILLADATGPVAETRRQFFFSLIGAFTAAVLAVTYSLWFRGVGLRPGPSLAWATAGIFCTPSWFYGTSTFDDMLGTSAVVLAVAVAFLGRERRPVLAAAVAGVLLGWAVNCKEPLAVFALPALAALYRPALPFRRQLVPATLVLGGVALGVLAYRAYDEYKFPPGTPDPNADYVERYGPMWTADPRPALAGFAFSPSAGVLWYCPTLLLSLAGFLVWRRREARFCSALAAASLLFVLFLSFLTFFKGEPCWGPRYLTPVFALWWLFVPAAFERLRGPLPRAMLGLGVVVQLLGLTVDPQRLLLAKAVPFNYYVYDPWLQFYPEASHLLQRPREIRDILACSTPAAEYSPAPLPTYATRIPPARPLALASLAGHAAGPLAPPLAAASALSLGEAGHGVEMFKDAVRRYHVFASFRPWWLSQQYLAPEERPVNLPRTAVLLLGLTAAGLGLMLLGGRAARGR